MLGTWLWIPLAAARPRLRRLGGGLWVPRRGVSIAPQKVAHIPSPSGTLWEPELVTLRAGGLIPIARQYPGARELVESHRREFPGAEISYHTASGYGMCQVLVEAVTRAASLDRRRSGPPF